MATPPAADAFSKYVRYEKKKIFAFITLKQCGQIGQFIVYLIRATFQSQRLQLISPNCLSIVKSFFFLLKTTYRVKF